MTKSGVSINWGGLKESLDRAMAGIAESQGLMTKIGMAMKGQTLRRFQAGAGPDGKAWKVSQRAAGRQAKGKRDKNGRFLPGSGKKSKGRGQTLLDTGRLRNSISFSAGALDVHVGSNVAYARIHQLGGQAGRGRKATIPARPYLGVGEEDRKEIANLVAEHLAGSFKR